MRLRHELCALLALVTSPCNIRGSFRRQIHISQVKGMVRDAVEVSPRRRRGGGRLREDKHAIAAVFDMSCS